MANPTDPHGPRKARPVTLPEGLPRVRLTAVPPEERKPAASAKMRHVATTRRLTATPPRQAARADYEIAWLEHDGRVHRRHVEADVDFGLEDICGVIARGALLEGEHGPIAIEDVAPGMRLRTLDGGLEVVRWVGRCTPDYVARAPSEEFLPLRVRAHALGERRPDQDLVVSARFRVLIDGPLARATFGAESVLAPLRVYTDGDRIARLYHLREAEFFNLMFDRHQVLRISGIASESFHPGTYGLATMPPELRSQMMRLFPHMGGDMAGFGPVARPRLRAFEAAALAGMA